MNVRLFEATAACGALLGLIKNGKAFGPTGKLLFDMIVDGEYTKIESELYPKQLEDLFMLIVTVDELERRGLRHHGGWEITGWQRLSNVAQINYNALVAQYQRLGTRALLELISTSSHLFHNPADTRSFFEFSRYEFNCPAEPDPRQLVREGSRSRLSLVQERSQGDDGYGYSWETGGMARLTQVTGKDEVAELLERATEFAR